MDRSNKATRQWQAIHTTNVGSDFSYREIGATRDKYPAGYDHDDRKLLIGIGREVFEIGKEAIRGWKMFSKSWTRIHVPDGIREGSTVSMAFRLLGRWWINACRIVYVVDDANRFGFAYGTLRQHVEKGEELFEVFIATDEKVYFRITAFSKPNKWFVRLAYPWARRQQRKFVMDAFSSIQQFVINAQKGTLV